MTFGEAKRIASTYSLDWADVVLITLSEIETRAVIATVAQIEGREAQRSFRDRTYYDLGEIGGARTVLVRAPSLQSQRGGSLQTITSAIQTFKPSTVILTGLALGVDKTTQQIGDILVAEQLHFYEAVKLDERRVIPRGDKVPSSTRLRDRFQTTALTWEETEIREGLLLSGEKVVASPSFLKNLLKREPEALGIELGGQGLYAAAEEEETKTDWIVVKSIGGWADGSDSDQASDDEAHAAHTVARFIIYTLQQGGLAPEEKQNLAEYVRSYLRVISGELADNPLLRSFGRRLDDIRLPLRVIPYDTQRDAEETRARSWIRREASGNDGTNETSRRVYQYRGSRFGNQDGQGRVGPQLLEDVALKSSQFVLLGDPGSGKTEWLKQSALKAANEMLVQLKLQAPTDTLIFPIYLRLNDVAKQLRKGDSLNDLLQAARCKGPGILSERGQTAAAILFALTQKYEMLVPLIKWLWRKLTESRRTGQAPTLLVCLDAWDEVRGDRAELAQSLRAFADATTARLMITSRIIGYVPLLSKETTAKNTIREWQLQPFTWNETEQFVTQFFRVWKQAEVGQRLVAELQQKVAITGMAQNPLLATLLCLSFLNNKLELPARRVDVYAQVLNGLIGEWNLHSERIDKYAIEPTGKLLAELAFHFFPDEELDDKGLYDFLWNDRSGYMIKLNARDPLFQLLDKRRAEDSGDIPEVLAVESILVPTGGNAYLFLHLTFQEYLTAYFLAKKINTDGWDAAAVWVRHVRREVPIKYLINKFSWLPEWQEVLILLAGELENPKPLLELLADSKQDDYARHRLSLAVFCFTELNAEVRLTLQPTIDTITKTAFHLWLKHRQLTREAIVPHLSRGLPALAFINGKIDKVPLRNYITTLLESRNSSMRQGAVAVVGDLGRAATPEILAALITRLGDTDDTVWREVFKTIIELGKTTAPEIVATLVARLRDSDKSVRGRAYTALNDLRTRAIPEVFAALLAPKVFIALLALLADPDFDLRQGIVALITNLMSTLTYHMELTTPEIRAALVAPEILDALTALLADSDDDVRAAAVYALKNLAYVAAVTPKVLTAEVLSALTSQLADSESEKRWVSAIALRMLGSTAATPEVIAALVAVARDSDHSMRANAVEILGNLGSAAATPEVIATLGARLSDSEWKVRTAAVVALGNLGRTTPEILVALVARVRDSDKYVREATIKVLGKLGGAAATPEVLTALISQLADSDWGVRQAPVEVLGKLGSAAATPEVLIALITQLANSNWEVRQDTIKVLGKLGSAAAIPKLLAFLVALASDPFHRGQEAINALGNLGSAAATPEVLAALVALAPDYSIGRFAVKALGNLGSAAATPEVLAALVARTRDLDDHTREAAVEALGKLGSTAATPEVLTALVDWSMRDFKDSVLEAAVETLGKLGSAAATPEVLTTLTARLSIKHSKWREAAAAAFTTLTSEHRVFQKSGPFVRPKTIVKSLDELGHL